MNPLVFAPVSDKPGRDDFGVVGIGSDLMDKPEIVRQHVDNLLGDVF